MEDLAEPAKSKGVDSVHRIIPDVDVSIEGLLNLRVDAQELPRLRVVVAPYSVVAHRSVTRASIARPRATADEVTARTGGTATPAAPRLTNH